jgi:hypothetical protein
MRRWAMAAVVSVLLVSLASPSIAATREIRYRGESEQGALVALRVVKRDSGKRTLASFQTRLITTCADETTRRIHVFTGDARISAKGGFELLDTRNNGPFGSYRLSTTGTVRFAQAEGTVELRYPALDSEGEAILCSSGELAWTAEREFD